MTNTHDVNQNEINLENLSLDLPKNEIELLEEDRIKKGFWSKEDLENLIKEPSKN